ncbi:MAG: metal ABC transporter permease [Oscillospiraceae bacterium]|nr:metal ABC transporter permease [Oscillospiraceae bacterium]
MIETILVILSHPFMQRAILVGSLVSISAALLGVILVLKRYAMIGDGLSHVGFGFISVALALEHFFAFGWAPLWITMPGVLVVAIILLKIKNNSKIKSDSAIALVSSSALAIGVAVTSWSTGMNLDTCNILFGSILGVTQSDLWISVISSILIGILFILYYRKLFAVTFDEDFAKASGLRARRYGDLIAILTGMIIVIGMTVMGTLLISSIIVFPALTSMRIFKSFKSVVISSGVISLVSFLIGIYLSFVHDISAGAMIVLVNLAFFIIFTIMEMILKK